MPKATLSTIAPFGYDIDITRFLEAFQAIGCTSFQFSRNRERPPSAAEVLATASRVGMSIDSMHGMFGPDLDPSSPDPAQREHCLKVYEKEAMFALELGGPMVVVHPCKSSPQRTDPPPPPLPLEEAKRLQRERWTFFRDFVRRLADVGHRLSVTFLIENLMLDCPLGHDPVQLAEQVMGVGSPRIRMCLDTGHAHTTLVGRSAAGAGAVGIAIKLCAPAIEYLHIHDNNGVRDLHVMPGRGVEAGGGETGRGGIDWESVGEALRRTECRATRMLEVFEDPALSGPSDALNARLRHWLAL